MAETVTKGSFPSQIVSDVEKISQEYGLKVAQAIENEWFGRDSGMNRFNTNQVEFHNMGGTLSINTRIKIMNNV